jgi:hypothetical protein
MRLLPGQPKDIANESISSYNLMRAAVVDPDMITTVYRLFPEEAPLTDFLEIKGLKAKGLYEGLANGQYKVTKSNVVMYPIANTNKRKMRFVGVFSNGACYASDAYPTTPGKDQTEFYVYLDSNWAIPKETLELADNRTLLYIIDDQVPEEYNGSFKYRVKVVTKIKATYCDPILLQEGMECTPVMTMYEHDFSETAGEKYTFDGWGRSYMTLQRFKHSWSGTAAAMKEGMKWTIHNGEKSFLSHADYLMMKRAAEYHEYAMVFGQGTVDEDGNILMKDTKGREVMAGDGIMYQGEGAFEYPVSVWNMNFIEGIMSDIDLRRGKDGLIEAVVMGGKQAISNFSRVLREAGFTTMNNNVEGSGASKGVNNSYEYYEIDGVRLKFIRYRYFDTMQRPSIDLPDGTRRSSHDAIIVPLGVDDNGNNGIEMMTLRGVKSGTVKGIDAGGDIASSIDGSHKHLLFQSGVICRNKVSRIFKPVPTNANPVYYVPAQS